MKLFIFVKAYFKILVDMLVKCQAILTWKLTFTDAYRQLSNLPFDTLNLAQWVEFIFEGIFSFLCRAKLIQEAKCLRHKMAWGTCRDMKQFFFNFDKILFVWFYLDSINLLFWYSKMYDNKKKRIQTLVQ